MRLHIFQHEASCGPGAIEEWLIARAIDAHYTRFYKGDELPALDEVDALLVLGGAMNVYQDDEFPHLKPLRAFTREALYTGKKVFGICLGAQIMADALNSRVVRAPQRECGWIEIMRRDEALSSRLLGWLPERQRFVSFHGDTFAVPEGAVHGAQSAVCAAQAFAWGDNALAVQFHPEANASIVAGWIDDEPEEERPKLREMFLPFASRFARQKLLLFAALDAWIR